MGKKKVKANASTSISASIPTPASIKKKKIKRAKLKARSRAKKGKIPEMEIVVFKDLNPAEEKCAAAASSKAKKSKIPEMEILVFEELNPAAEECSAAASKAKKCKIPAMEIVVFKELNPEVKEEEKSCGFIFMCNSTTKPECYRHQVFGLPRGEAELVERMKPGTKLFLYDFELQLLYGIYSATFPGGLNLVPEAFGGAFPAQVKFKIDEDCPPLAYSSLKQAILENYDAKNRFHLSLSSKQVHKLVALFRSASSPPQTVPSPYTENRLPPAAHMPPLEDPCRSAGQVGDSHLPPMEDPCRTAGQVVASHLSVGPVTASYLLPPNDRVRSRRSESSANHGDNKKYEVDIERIVHGEDVRTTLMVKNIPRKYTSKMLLAAIDENHKGTYDFIYLPFAFKNKCTRGYAFINMVDPQHIIPFFQAFNGKRWQKFNSEKVASFSYARIQGKSAFIAHFQNSSLMSLMNEDKRCRPILFYSDGPNAGDQEPFPMWVNIGSRPGRSRDVSSANEENQESPSTSPNGVVSSDVMDSAGGNKDSE